MLLTNIRSRCILTEKMSHDLCDMLCYSWQNARETCVCHIILITLVKSQALQVSGGKTRLSVIIMFITWSHIIYA